MPLRCEPQIVLRNNVILKGKERVFSKDVRARAVQGPSVGMHISPPKANAGEQRPPSKWAFVSSAPRVTGKNFLYRPTSSRRRGAHPQVESPSTSSIFLENLFIHLVQPSLREFSDVTQGKMAQRVCQGVIEGSPKNIINEGELTCAGGLLRCTCPASGSL